MCDHEFVVNLYTNIILFIINLFEDKKATLSGWLEARKCSGARQRHVARMTVDEHLREDDDELDRDERVAALISVVFCGFHRTGVDDEVAAFHFDLARGEVEQIASRNHTTSVGIAVCDEELDDMIVHFVFVLSDETLEEVGSKKDLELVFGHELTLLEEERRVAHITPAAVTEENVIQHMQANDERTRQVCEVLCH